MLTKALPIFALLVCFGLMAVAPARRFATRVGIEFALLLAVGVPLLLKGATLVPTVAGKPDEPWLQALAVIWWMVAARLIVTIVTTFTTRAGPGRQERLFSDLAKAAIYLSAVLFVMNFVLQIPLQGLLATSGVIAIVLGLALQNTLADVFAGIAVGIEQPFHVGDEIAVADHVEGTVVQMNWRSVRIQQAGDLAVIPNSLIAKGQITNRSRPTRRRAQSVEVSIEAVLSPETVAELIAHALLLCPDALRDSSPSVQLTRLETKFLTFSVSYVVTDSEAIGSTRDLILRQIARQLRLSGARVGRAPAVTSLLGDIEIFRSLSPAQLAALAGLAKPLTLETGETLFDAGSQGISLFIIQAGVLEVHRPLASNQYEALGRVGPGEYIGEVSLLSGSPHQVSALALVHCRALELPRSALEQLVRDDPDVLETLKKSVARGLSALSRDEAARCAHPKVEEHQLFGWLRGLLGTEVQATRAPEG